MKTLNPKKKSRKTKAPSPTATESLKRKSRKKVAVNAAETPDDPKQHSDVMSLAQSVFGDDEIVDELKDELRSESMVRTLFAMRSARGVSQHAIAEQLNCTQGRVSKIENGTDAKLKVGELEAYARAMGLDAVVTFRPHGSNGVDRVKQHAFAIRRELDCLAEMAHTDAKLAEGISSFFGESLFNFIRLWSESAKSLPASVENENAPRVKIELTMSSEPCRED